MNTVTPSALKKSNERSLRDALADLIDSSGMREKMDELDITTAWDDVAGPMIARHTLAIRLRRGKLHVKVDSAPLRQELTYMREAMKEILNRRAGREVVQEIVLE